MEREKINIIEEHDDLRVALGVSEEDTKKKIIDTLAKLYQNEKSISAIIGKLWNDSELKNNEVVMAIYTLAVSNMLMKESADAIKNLDEMDSYVQ